MMRATAIGLGVVLAIAPWAYAHQPVMDMAPRWEGGSGLQVRYEALAASDLVVSGTRVLNPLGLHSSRNTTWLEGVYTFHRSFRITFKQPYHLLSKRVFENGQTRNLEAAGFGDLILTTPIKRYANYMDHTWNLGFNPSVTLPTGKTRGPIPQGRGAVDYGLSVSYALESPRFFGLWDLFGQFHRVGDDRNRQGNLIGFDMNVGRYLYVNSANEFATLLLWGTHIRREGRDLLASGTLDGDTGRLQVEMAPILVILYQNYAVRLETYFPVYRDVNGTQLVNDYMVSVGIGTTFASPAED